MMSLDRFGQDLKGAVRSITRYPVAAFVAVVSLAFGIGALTTTLTVRDVIFHKPPPAYGHPSALSRVQFGRPDRPITPLGGRVPGPLVETIHRSLGWRAAAATPPRGGREVRAEDRTETIAVRAVTPEFFSVLEVAPALGRLSFEGGSQPAAVLSYRIWRYMFDQRPDVIGRPLWIDGRSYVVGGVLPEHFWFSAMNSSIWIAIEPAALAVDDGLEVVVRRADGVSPDALAAQLQGALATYLAGQPVAERQSQLRVGAVEGTPLGHQMALLLPYVLAGSVVLTLIIACANVAILMLAQWTAREHEIAIRASLGASRSRVVRALVAESLLLAAAGGAFGVCATLALRGLVVLRAPGTMMAFFDLSIEPHIFVEALMITVASGLVAGIAPALYETRRLHANPLTALAASDRSRQRLRHALVVVEISVTVALLVETGAMVDGYQRTMAAEMGFDRRPLFALRVENNRGVSTRATLERIAAVPGVASAAAATGLPYMGAGTKTRVAIDAGATTSVAAERIAVSPGFFATLGVPVESGREFAGRDTPSSRVGIVNAALARQLTAGGGAIGRRVFADGAPFDIVGVAGDYAVSQFQERHSSPKLFVPLPIEDASVKELQVVVRAASDPAALLQTVRREMRDAAAGNSVPSSFTYDEITRVAAQELLVGTAPLVPLIAIGMLLTTAGIYGVLAFAIARRSRELAVRVAIGASHRDLIRLVSAHSARLVAIGTACGIGVTFALSRIVRASGGAGSIYDPAWPSFVVPIVILGVIGGLATLVPSRRVLRIDPAVVLRES